MTKLKYRLTFTLGIARTTNVFPVSASLKAFVPVVTGAEVIAARLPIGAPQSGGMLDLAKGGVNWSLCNTTNAKAPQSGNDLNFHS
jgi:hypothetical protein